MTKLVTAVGGVLLIGATIVLLFTALFSGQMASYSGGVCVPVTATSTTVGISPTTTASPTGGISCYPASGNGSTVSMAALSIAAHLYGNPDTWYDAGMPTPVLHF